MEHLRLGTYNILIPRTDDPEKGADSWLVRAASVIDTIDSSFDLVGLQECSFRAPCEQGETVANALASLGWESYLPHSKKLFDDCFHERLPIFWRPEAFKLESAGQLLLSSWTPQELALVPILENRYSSFVRGELSCGRKILFFTVHLQHSTAKASFLEKKFALDKRKKSIQTLLSYAKSIQNEGELLMIAGDFNTTEKLDEFAQAGLKEISESASTKERWSYNSFHNWAPETSGLHLDRIFVSQELSGGVARIGESIASDHYPVSYQLP